MIHQQSKIHESFSPSNCKPFKVGRDFAMDELPALMAAAGIGMSKGVQDVMAAYYAMDSIQQPTLTASVPTPVQFIQTWLPGLVEIITAARKIDMLIGKVTMGSWSDAQVVQQVVENTGAPVPYGDTTVVPLANWNQNFIYRDVVRFELGMRVGVLEQERSARARVDSAGQKRGSAAIQLEIQRNAVGFNGYNSGLNLTYGILNDPNLSNYVTVATVGGNTTWASKTFLQIQGDILTGLQQLRTNSQDTIDPGSTPITLAVATSCRDYLAKTSDFGISVMDWLKSTYPNVRVESAPQLNAASGGLNVFYLYADRVNDGVSTDDQATFIQCVPAVFQLLGVSQQTKAFEEDYSNATAGVMVKRPYAIVRYNGI